MGEILGKKPFVVSLSNHERPFDKRMANAQVTRARLLNKHPHLVPIPGMLRASHLEQNVEAIGGQLTADDVAELNELFPSEKVVGVR